MIIFLWLSCSEAPTSNLPSDGPPPEPSAKTQPNKMEENWDQGQQHPPIPADNPIWEWDAKGFVPDHGWYGEHSWTDVRMRVLGHLSIAGRDYARIAAQHDDLAEAAQRYAQLVAHLKAIPIPTHGHANDIAQALIESAQRDQDLLEALSNNRVPAANQSGFAELRRQYYVLALEENPHPDALRELQKKLTAYLSHDPSLAIDGFEDFLSRHELRTRLFTAYNSSLDPLGISECWGYWTDTEQIRQALSIGWALGRLGGDDWTEKLSDFQESPISEPTLDKRPPIFWPSEMAEVLQSPNMQSDFSHREFVWLPTGDSLIDVAGQPGPMAIGTLMKLGIDDSEYKEWLTPKLEELKHTFETSGDVVSSLNTTLSELQERYQHGSVFYTHKQLRNATLRQLARNKRYSEAYLVHQLNFPLHHQDWACPNREGLLRALGGRLLAEANDSKAEPELLAAIQSSLDFLEKVNAAEKGQIKGPRPPQLNLPGQGPAAPHKPKGTPNGPMRAHRPQQ